MIPPAPRFSLFSAHLSCIHTFIAEEFNLSLHSSRASNSFCPFISGEFIISLRLEGKQEKKEQKKRLNKFLNPLSLCELSNVQMFTEARERRQRRIHRREKAGGGEQAGFGMLNKKEETWKGFRVECRGEPEEKISFLVFARFSNDTKTREGKILHNREQSKYHQS
jgi:hypothetical protein